MPARANTGEGAYFMPYCSSCGNEIPEGQGSSCSMCYGDMAYGSDGYYEDWARNQEDPLSNDIGETDYDGDGI